MSKQVNLYSEWVKTTPLFRDYTPIIFNKAASKKVHDLSITDWREWIAYVRPPLEKTFIQIDIRGYVEGNDVIEALIIMTDKTETRMAVQGKIDDDKTILASPYTLSFDLSERTCGAMEIDYQQMGFGPKIADQFGLPDMPRIGGNNSRHIQSYSDDLLESILREFAGQGRIAMAAMALINMHGDLSNIPEKSEFLYRGRSKSRKEYIPVFATHNITIDTSRKHPKPRGVLRTCAPKRLHGVRGHFRHFRNSKWGNCNGVHIWNAIGEKQHCNGCGSKRTWVEHHERGDESLGIVTANYNVK